jgi:hypothetical protein
MERSRRNVAGSLIIIVVSVVQRLRGRSSAGRRTLPTRSGLVSRDARVGDRDTPSPRSHRNSQYSPAGIDGGPDLVAAGSAPGPSRTSWSRVGAPMAALAGVAARTRGDTARRRSWRYRGDGPVKQDRFDRRRGFLGVLLLRRSVRASVFVACWSLLLQVLAPAVHLPHLRFGGGIGASSFTAICHGEGALADSSNQGQERSKETPAGAPPDCLICVGALAAASILLPPLIRVQSLSPVQAVSFPQRDHGRLASSHRILAQPRAPPASA